MDTSAFEKLATEMLDDMMEAIDEQLGDSLDVDLNGGILTVELDDGGQYIINKHGASSQIWMSSPFSGATHYDFDESADVWVSTKGGESLTDVLSAELSKATGKNFEL